MAKTRFRYRVLDIMQQALNQKVMEQTERTYISSLLHSTNGRMGIAAKKSGID